MISTHAGGKRSASRPGSFTPRERAVVPIGSESGWASEPVWTTWRIEISRFYRDSNSDPSVVRPVASRYTDWAMPAPSSDCIASNSGQAWDIPRSDGELNICELSKLNKQVRSEVNMRIAVFCYVTPCSLGDRYEYYDENLLSSSSGYKSTIVSEAAGFSETLLRY
jgi:hypothetical protein